MLQDMMSANHLNMNWNLTHLLSFITQWILSGSGEKLVKNHVIVFIHHMSSQGKD